MTDENGAPQNSEDESTACYSGNGLHVSITELELEIKDLERMLKQERNEKRRIKAEAQYHVNMNYWIRLFMRQKEIQKQPK
uniref:Uncharacterized protein n=1 Tax=Heterorhabditis bacteriophora TaxID=37862 RepID=A0A1I7WN50_HETBA